MSERNNPNLGRLLELEAMVAKESETIKDKGIEKALEEFFGPKEIPTETAEPGNDPISQANKNK